LQIGGASLSRGVAVAAFSAALAWVLAAQPHDDGFRRGHRGWVSAHTLAIAEKATPSNGFVGYSVALSTPASRDLYYFDRYPVFFSAALHAVQDLMADDAAERIHIARQVMNLVYVLTLVAAVALMVELGLSLELAIAAATLAGAGYTMVEYRDMVHFDQPALLGFVVLLWAIARFGSGGGSRVVLVATAAAVMSGRGYASYAVLGSWWILDTLRRLRGRSEASTQQSTPGLLRSVATSTPTRACLLGIAIGAACLSYNVMAEARTRGVALSKVGIVQSASQRLSLDDRFNDKTQKRRSWARFLKSQEHGVALTALPWALHGPIRKHDVVRVLVSCAVLVVALGFAASRPEPARTAWLLACIAGPLWLLAMRNLAAFHPYTAMYMFPLCLTFFAAMLRLVPARLGAAAAVVACAVLFASTNDGNREIVRLGKGLRHDTIDMHNIARALRPGDAVATDGQLFPGVPFALGFYLPGQDIVVEGPASLVISRRSLRGGQSLTPGNRGIFLTRFDSPRRVRSPLARLHPDSDASQRRHKRQAPPDDRRSSRER